MDGHDILIFYSAEDQAYIADIPDFDMCSAHGPTPQAALEEVLLAYRAIVQTLEETGRPRPAPQVASHPPQDIGLMDNRGEFA